MRKDIVYLAIILILLGIVVVMTCTGPDPVDPAAEQYKDSVKILKSEKAIISSRIEAIGKASVIRQKSDSAKLALSLKEIARLKVKASKAVEAIPVEVIRDNPEIMIAIVAKDSVITKQGQAIDSLQQSLAFQIQVKEDLMSDHYNAAKIDAQLQEMAEVRIVTLEKDLRKSQRRNRGLKALAVVGTVLGIIGGSQL